MNLKYEISILIPTINEEDNVASVLNLIKKSTNNNINKEIIFIDDNSSDKTVEKINLLKKNYKSIKLINSKSRLGLGHAINQGIKKSSGKYILCLDCDCAVSSSDLKRIINLRSENSVVIGSRYLKNSKIINCSKIKIFLSRMVNVFIAFYYNIDGRDLTQSLRIFPKLNGFKPNNLTHPAYFIEMSIFLNKKKLIFKEVPVFYNNRIAGLTKNSTFNLLKSTLSFFIK
jgi:dolichol-phosphate mannosyltransferase